MRRMTRYSLWPLALAVVLILVVGCDDAENDGCGNLEGAFFFTCTHLNVLLLDVRQEACTLDGTCADPVSYPGEEWLSLQGTWTGSGWHLTIYDNVNFPGEPWIECEKAEAGKVFDCEDSIQFPGYVERCSFWTSP